MTMRRVESQEGLGQFVNDPNKTKAGLAKTLIEKAKTWRELYGDIPLASVAAPVEKQAVKTPEVPVEVKRFSTEALEFLKTKDLLHYPLNRQSLKAQKLAGRPFWYIVDAGDNFLTLPSMSSEVAFHPAPNKFFLPKSNNLTLAQQQEMIAEYSHKLQREFGSEEIKAVMGDAPDYTSLAFLHLDATQGKERLFGQKYGFNYARTKTPTSSSFVAAVGHFGAGDGLGVSRWAAGGGNGGVHAAPLVVPV